MPGLKHAPSRGQPATHFSFADIAEFDDVDLGDLKDRIKELALRQDLPVKTDWIDTAKFVLADRNQVESPDWCSSVRPAVVVRCVGKDTERYRYGFEPSAEVVTPDIPVCYGPTRDALLKLCLWDIVKALSQGRAVVVHCNQSFHRGPCGLMAILKTLLDIPVLATKAMILAKRDVWEGYVGPMKRHGDSLVRAYHWASELELWRPPVTRRAADRWGQPRALSQAEVTAARLQAEEGKYLYRAMTQGLVEFDAQPASSQGVVGIQLAHLVLDSVATGSTRVSEFVHFSRKFLEARHWHMRGKESRGETGTIMCRVPILALSQVHDLNHPLRRLEYVDLSSQGLSRRLIREWDMEDLIEPLLPALGHAEKVNEVVVAWRGSMPKSLFEVINTTTGEFIRMLDPRVPLLASSHWRQTSVEAINPAVFKSLCCYSFRCCAIFQFTVNLYLLYPEYTTFAFVLSKLELSICVLLDMIIIVLYFEL